MCKVIPLHGKKRRYDDWFILAIQIVFIGITVNILHQIEMKELDPFERYLLQSALEDKYKSVEWYHKDSVIELTDKLGFEQVAEEMQMKLTDSIRSTRPLKDKVLISEKDYGMPAHTLKINVQDSPDGMVAVSTDIEHDLARF